MTLFWAHLVAYRTFHLKRLLLLLAPAAFITTANTLPARSGDLGIADMREAVKLSNKLQVFEGSCGGPLSDTIKPCKMAFIEGKLVISESRKKNKQGVDQFNTVRGITPSQVKSMSWHEPPNTNKPQQFVNEIIYQSSERKWTRAGFIFWHGDQARGFYSGLMRWMSGTSEP